MFALFLKIQPFKIYDEFCSKLIEEELSHSSMI